ncbi:unnamed protein product [Trichobilharzia regenti]|nr:unnamed protein product [Trichobilharzia regenti]
MAKSTISRDIDTEPAKAAGVFLTCACVSGFSRPVKDSEVLNLFPSILIPGDAVKMTPDGTTAFIDFISENNCRRAVSETSTEGSKAKQTHPTIHIEAISRGEMLNRLGLDTKGDEQSNFDKPVRPRRGKYDDPSYDRPVPPAPFDEYRDPFRRFRPPMDNLHSIPPPQTDPVPAPRPPLPAPHRRPNPDFVSVFVGNLPPGFTVDQLAGVMRDYYFIPGSIRLRRNPQGQPTGEALVDFKTSYEADRALRGLNGYRIAGRPLVLRFDHRN